MEERGGGAEGRGSRGEGVGEGRVERRMGGWRRG